MKAVPDAMAADLNKYDWFVCTRECQPVGAIHREQGKPTLQLVSLAAIA